MTTEVPTPVPSSPEQAEPQISVDTNGNAAGIESTGVNGSVASGGTTSTANGTAPTPTESVGAADEEQQLRPSEVVRRLDEYIIGQGDAKRAIAIALRNRVRRQQLADDMRDEVLPKNILMIGPTGVGKTEIARRVAKLTASPFIKVEATKFTEVGYVGRDVESIVRDLLEQTITEVHNDRIAEVEDHAKALAESRILDALVDSEEKPAVQRTESATDASSEADAKAQRRRKARRRRLAKALAGGAVEGRFVDIEVEEPFQPAFEGFAGTGLEEVGVSLSDFFSQMAPPRKKQKRMTVADARTALVEEETDRLIDMDRVYDDAIRLVEDDGVVFIDEVDKICGPTQERGPDVSGEGVQRDLLPLMEGSTVHTRYGPVHTDHILFVGAGAFNVARPSDLIPEFQGRFPIRVELKALSEADLVRILTEPSNALTKQYAALLRTERLTLEFAPDGIRELARQAYTINEQDENLGARRLFTVVEKVLDELSFRAEDYTDQTVTIDADYVRAQIGDLVRNQDLRRYVL